MIRQANRVRVFLNGVEEPEIDAELDVTSEDSRQLYWGARSDQFAPLQGNLAQVAFFDRPLEAREALELHTTSGQPRGTSSILSVYPGMSIVFRYLPKTR